MRLSETCKLGLESFYYLPHGLANSTEVMDKVCKFVIALIECNRQVTQSFKDATGIFSTLGLITTVKPMIDFNGTFWTDRKKTPLAKMASKVVLAAAQTLDMVKGLDALKLVSLGTISNALGRFRVFAVIIKQSPPLGVAKDALIVISTLFSLKANLDESERLSKLVFNGRNIKHENAIHTNRIAIIADIFKIAIVGLMVGIALTGAGMSTVIVTTSYGALTLGMTANGIGLISASAALVKSLRGHAITQGA